MSNYICTKSTAPLIGLLILILSVHLVLVPLVNLPTQFRTPIAATGNIVCFEPDHILDSPKLLKMQLESHKYGNPCSASDTSEYYKSVDRVVNSFPDLVTSYHDQPAVQPYWRDSIRNIFYFLKRDDWVHPGSLYARHRGEFGFIASQKNCLNETSSPFTEPFFLCRSINHSVDNAVRGVAYGPIVCNLYGEIAGYPFILGPRSFRGDLNGKFAIQTQVTKPDVYTFWEYIVMYMFTMGSYQNDAPEFMLPRNHIVECLTKRVIK